MLLEICAGNIKSAMNAELAGAQRIELCGELAVGGITPSHGFLKQVIESVSIPVFVLIRPRSGNFTYSEAEFKIMKQDIQFCKDLGCAGIVSGILNPDQTIDIDRIKELLALSKPMAFTFHRAFDWTPNPFNALDILNAMKIERVLTSGHANSAERGLEILIELHKKSANEVIILPGGGINPENAQLFKTAGFKEIHASASTQNEVTTEPSVKMNSPKFFNETTEYYSDIIKIKSILKCINDEI